jgi:hypothetical protein
MPRGADDLSTSPGTVRRPIFTFRTKERLTKQRIKEEVVRKARHVLKGAVLDLVRRIVTPGVELLGGDRLGVQIIGDRDLVVSCRESGLSITYRKDALAPMLIAVDGIDRSSEPSKVKFWAQAWKAAYHKARTLGWLSG